MKRIDLPSSDRTFPGGYHFGIEVSGIETAEILEAVVDEAHKQNIPIHRMIATVRGSMFYSDAQLRELAKVAAENRIEVIICPGNLAQQVIDDPTRILDNLNFRSWEELAVYITEIDRCLNFGFRGFLVWRKSILERLNDARRASIIPEDVIFKLSTFDGNRHPLDFILAEELGADTVNVANNVPLDILAAIRSEVSVVMDAHITFWNLGFQKNAADRLELTASPYDRIADAPEIARICSPVYFKFEAGTPGIGVYNIGPGWTFEDLAEHKRKDVRVAAEIVERIKREYPELKLSDWGPEDLRVPKGRFKKV